MAAVDFDPDRWLAERGSATHSHAKAANPANLDTAEALATLAALAADPMIAALPTVMPGKAKSAVPAIDWEPLTALPSPVGYWADAVRLRCAQQAPTSITLDRWKEVEADAASFIRDWGGPAAASGWDERDLFCCPPGPERWGRSGLVSLLRGRPVLAVDGNTITIGNSRGGPNRYRQNPHRTFAGCVMIWSANAFSIAPDYDWRRS